MNDHRKQINAAYQKKVVDLLEKVTAKTALDVQADLDKQTPRDTGRAASNWLASIGKPRTFFVEQFTGSEPIDLSGYKLGQHIYIANNLPYIRRLNDGHSQQAPAGFVNVVVQRHAQRASEIARKVKS